MLLAAHWLKSCWTLLLLATTFCHLARPVRSAPIVWSGLTHTFTKTDAVPADQITANVALTRGATRGLFNAMIDKGYNGSGPSDTEWATNLTSAGQTITASNWEALSFEPWLTAFGGTGMIGHLIEGRDAVVHLISDDIYLDLRFTDWELRAGGFAYLRAVAPSNIPGDYNHNGIVDAADYTLWRDTLGSNVTPGSGADGNANARIDQGDYNFWKSRFGQVAGSAASFGGTPIPEPAGAVIILMGATLLALARRSSRQPHASCDN